MKSLKYIALIIVVILSIGLFSSHQLSEEISQDAPQTIEAVKVPTYMEFAGESVPLENFDVNERLDFQLQLNTFRPHFMIRNIKLANRYFPTIEKILVEEGVPDDFKYLAVIESGLTNAVSPAGARGVWQIMPATGRENGLEVNKNVDERYNLEKATVVACKYLLEAKEQLGSWTLAAGSYNAGKAGISRRLKEQEVSSYYDLLLGEETGRYLFRIIALKEILSNPTHYGFNFRDKDLYSTVPTFKVEVDTAVRDFSQFAQKFSINYKILKLHNPWLREPHLNNGSRKSYQIEIPEKGYYDLVR
ncbi:MAG: lytic transglycosylase domain-containing protein [Saprospiraceae bacterium]